MNIGLAFLPQVRDEAPFAAKAIHALEIGVVDAYHVEHNPDDTHATIHSTDRIYERWPTRTAALGYTVTPPFRPTDFTASAAMTWTVAAGDISNFSYYLLGPRMVLDFQIVNTTVGGVASTRLQMKIPANLRAARGVLTMCRVIDNGVIVVGFATMSAQDPYISIGRLDNGNFAAAAGTTSVQGQIDFEVSA